jgi:uncharacterized protein YtpQ (UPF0354 family)
MSLNNLDKYIEGYYNNDSPVNESEEKQVAMTLAEVLSNMDAEDEKVVSEAIYYLEMEIKKLKYAYRSKCKSVEILVENIDEFESHTYVKNILKDLFL